MSSSKPRRRGSKPLGREQIVAAALAIADAKGAAGVTMRAVAADVGVEAMSLYNHVRGREDILDGMVDAVFAEIELPQPGREWRAAMRQRADSARAVLNRHSWAIGLMDSRSTPGMATLRHHNAVIGTLRMAGFSVAMTGHAVSVIDGYLYGFVLQERSLPFSDESGIPAVAEGILSQQTTGELPHLNELMAEHALRPGYDYGQEFNFGLDLILGALHPDEVD